MESTTSPCSGGVLSLGVDMSGVLGASGTVLLAGGVDGTSGASELQAAHDRIKSNEIKIESAFFMGC